MLKLKRKTCTIGIINNRIEKFGERDVTAFDMPLDMLLDPDELDSLVPFATKALFNTKGKVSEPTFPDFDSISLQHDLQSKAVTLAIGNGSTDYEIEFEDVRLKGLTLTPLIGGETGLTFKLQVRPATKHITRLLDAQNTSVKLTVGDLTQVEKAKKAQQELPLEAATKPTPTPEDDSASGIQRAIVAHQKKARRANAAKAAT